MIFLDFKEKLSDLGVFSLSDINKYFLKFDSRRLNEWQKKGYISKIKNGWYVFADYPSWEMNVFFAANRIYSPSYISLESALSYHGVIPEAVFSTSSVTTHKTKQFFTTLGNMYYFKMKENLFWGYELHEADKKQVKIATPEKAVLDLLYLRPSYRSKEDISQLRINKEVLNINTLKTYLDKVGGKTLKNKINILLKL